MKDSLMKVIESIVAIVLVATGIVVLSNIIMFLIK